MMDILPRSTIKTVETLLTDAETLQSIERAYIRTLEKTCGDDYISTYRTQAASLVQSIKHALDRKDGSATCEIVTDLLGAIVKLDCPSNPALVEKKAVWKFLKDRSFILANVGITSGDMDSVEIVLSWEEDHHGCGMGDCPIPCPTKSRQETEGVLFMTFDLLAERQSGSGVDGWDVSLDGSPHLLLDKMD